MFRWFKVAIFVYIVVGLGLMIFFVPPFQKPDEILHFERAASNAENLLINRRKGVIKYRYLDFVKKTNAERIAFKYDQKFDLKELFYRDENKDLVKSENTIGGYWLGYLPSTVGILIGGLSVYPVWALWGGRIVGGILFLISIGFSLRLLRRTNLQYIVLAYAVLPMVWQQVTAIGHDVLPLVLSPLIFALLVKTCEEKPKWKYFALYVLCLVVFVISKSGYQFMILLAALPLFKYYGIFVRRFWIAILLPIFFSLYLFRAKLLTLFISILPSGVLGQKEVFLRDPMYVLGVVWNTLSAHREFYVRSFLGYFGWLDYSFDFYTCFVLLFIFGVLVYLSFRSLDLVLSKTGLLFLGLVIFISFYLIIFVFYFASTPIGSDVVEGPQGRYFLVLVPFVIFFLTQLSSLIGREKTLQFLTFFAMLTVVYNLYLVIQLRYFDKSTVYEFNNPIERVINGEYNQPLTWEKIDKKITFNIQALSGKRVVGIQALVKTENSNYLFPYRVSIKDGDCKNELGFVYVSQKLIKGENELFFQKLKPFKMTDIVACIEVEPIVSDFRNPLMIRKGVQDYVFDLIYLKD